MAERSGHPMKKLRISINRNPCTIETPNPQPSGCFRLSMVDALCTYIYIYIQIYICFEKCPLYDLKTNHAKSLCKSYMKV